jgi:hypothetical protein
MIQHKSKRKSLCRGEQDYSCARDIYFESSRIVENIYFERYAIEAKVHVH